ncbi:hypothetical protein [Streptomyces xanthophaeus]|uniref:hypothetical protein n=1 Tax=Streptomyces xanthophaeus TaxID=67385 RepID=UPI0037224BFA
MQSIKIIPESRDHTCLRFRLSDDRMKGERMYSYVLEFNLGMRGDDAEEYLAEAVRTWPRYWEEIPGVTRTLLLCNAFALAGNYQYKWRVDVETLSALSSIDRVMKAGDGGWREMRAKWFKARTEARAQMLQYVAGNERHLDARRGEEGAIHLVLHDPSQESKSAEDRLRALEGASGVVSAQALRRVLGPGQASKQIWLQLESLDGLDGVAASSDLAAGPGELFGELREVDGALFAGA